MLILLDIDGVMVPAKSWKSPEILEDGFPAFSNKSILSLQKILTATNAKIILTTSHKSNYELSAWKQIFKNRELEISDISRLEKNSNFLSRKDEIIKWYESNITTESFIIIDDDKSLNDLPVFLKSRLIQTLPIIGLTEELADEGIRLFETEVLIKG
jgi:hypothetical protein